MPELVCAAADPRWLAERRKGVTATDITAILGLSPYQSPYGLWWEKTSPDMPEQVDSDRLRLGRELERYTITRWEEANPSREIIAGNFLYRSRDRAWQLATIDAQTPGYQPLEVKSWADADKSRWQDGPPARVRAQVLWQMDTLDVGTGHVGVVFLPSGEFRSYTIEHEACFTVDKIDMESCSICEDIDAMRDAGHEFYQRMTGELPPPDVDGSAATLAALRARFADPRKDKSAPVDADLWEHYTDIKHLVKTTEQLMRGDEALIREQIGEASLIEVGGETVGRRIIVNAAVKAHTRHQDYLKIIKREGDESDGE
jgi:putative phage-type endonuclease